MLIEPPGKRHLYWYIILSHRLLWVLTQYQWLHQGKMVTALFLTWQQVLLLLARSVHVHVTLYVNLK